MNRNEVQLIHARDQRRRRRAARNHHLHLLRQLGLVRVIRQKGLYRRRTAVVRHALVFEEIPDDVVVDFAEEDVGCGGGGHGPGEGPA